MELHAVETARFVGNAGQRRVAGLCDDAEAGRQGVDSVAMAHPDVEQAVALRAGMVLDIAQQPGMAARAHLRIAVLALARRGDAAAELRGHSLHAVADAEHGHTEVEHQRVGTWCRGLVHRLRTAGQDHALRREAADRVRRQIPGMQLAVDTGLAHPPRDQLAVLRAEVQDQNAVGMNVCGHRRGLLDGLFTRAGREAMVSGPRAASSIEALFLVQQCRGSATVSDRCRCRNRVSAQHRLRIRLRQGRRTA